MKTSPKLSTPHFDHLTKTRGTPESRAKARIFQDLPLRPAYKIRPVLGYDPLDRVEQQGHAFRFHWEKNGIGDEMPVSEKRRGISKFSQSSKRRLADLLASLEPQEIHFVTLTYPPELVHEPADWKDELRFFHERMARDFEDISMIWRLEKQSNGSPHFHLLVFNVEIQNDDKKQQQKNTAVFMHAVIKHWQGVLKTERTMPHFQMIENKIGAYLYFCGHAGKANQVWVGKAVGRYWGIKGKKTLRMSECTGGLPTVQTLRLLKRYWHAQETARCRWLRNRGKKGKPRKFTSSGKYFFRIPVQILLEKSGIPPQDWFFQADEDGEISENFSGKPWNHYNKNYFSRIQK